jgi:hypothetical protein
LGGRVVPGGSRPPPPPPPYDEGSQVRWRYHRGMKMHLRDLEKRLEPGVWGGLWLSVTEQRAPRFAVSVCPPRCLRVSISDAPVLWARVDDDYYGYEVLRAQREGANGILPPIPFGVADGIAAQGAEAAVRSWARYFAQALAESSISPLSDGEWSLSPRVDWCDAPALSPDDISEVLSRPPREYVDWSLDAVRPLPLRAMSPDDAGRVKAWRKLARRGELPPVLLYWISGLAASVVLDGHDRLLAAHLEGTPAPVFTLSSAYETTRDADDQQAVWNAVGLAFEHSERKEIAHQDGRKFHPEKANRILMDAFTPFRVWKPTLAAILEGGHTRWQSEVHAEAQRQGVDLNGLIDDVSK